MADLLHMPFFEQNCSKSCYLNCNKTMQLIIIAYRYCCVVIWIHVYVTGKLNALF